MPHAPFKDVLSLPGDSARLRVAPSHGAHEAPELIGGADVRTDHEDTSGFDPLEIGQGHRLGEHQHAGVHRIGEPRADHVDRDDVELVAPGVDVAHRQLHPRHRRRMGVGNQDLRHEVVAVLAAPHLGPSQEDALVAGQTIQNGRLGPVQPRRVVVRRRPAAGIRPRAFFHPFHLARLADLPGSRAGGPGARPQAIESPWAATASGRTRLPRDAPRQPCASSAYAIFCPPRLPFPRQSAHSHRRPPMSNASPCLEPPHPSITLLEPSRASVAHSEWLRGRSA